MTPEQEYAKLSPEDKGTLELAESIYRRHPHLRRFMIERYKPEKRR